ncbi:MAG: DNA recombination protein RmuC [Candidatus Nanopelagicales bacterium]
MNDMTALTFLGLLTLFALLLAGAAVAGWLIGRSASSARAAAARADLARTEADSARELAQLREDLARSAGRLETEHAARRAVEKDLDWQRRQNGDLEKSIAPLKSAFDGLTTRLKATEDAELKARTELKDKIAQMATDFGRATADVRTEARKLSTVLSRSDRRGAWGEMQLEALVESSGMLPHVHYIEQDHTTGDSGVLRPDLVISLAGGRSVIVDSKVPLDAFLRMSDNTPEDDSAALEEHGRLVHNHILRLSEKAYWKRYNSPEFVIMFLPSEGLLSSALEVRPELLQTGLDRKVLLATPATLMAMLHTISHSWQQVQAADEAREIHRLALEYHERMLGTAGKFEKLGKSLERSVKDFNGLLATVESRVLPTGRKFEKLAVPGAGLRDLDAVDEPVRQLGVWPSPTDQAALEADLVEPEIDLTDPQTPPEANPGDSSAA